MANKYNLPALQKWADHHAKTFWLKAKKVYGDKIGALPPVKLNARLTSTAGRAWLQEGFIDLSCYLMSNNPEEFAKNTIPHELCHMIAWRLYQDKGHGKPWKHTMMTMGLPPDTYHTMETLAMAKAKK